MGVGQEHDETTGGICRLLRWSADDAADTASGAPPAACPAQGAHACLLHHHPVTPLSEAGWVDHCTSTPGTTGSITSAGTPWSTAVADSAAPSPACPPQGAHAPPAPTPPCKHSHLGWVSSLLHKQPWHSQAACRVRQEALPPPLPVPGYNCKRCLQSRSSIGLHMQLVSNAKAACERAERTARAATWRVGGTAL